jgi:hypothetical protein
MKQAAISLGLGLALLAAPAPAQTVAAGARAKVSSDALPVYATMSASGAPKATLKRGEHVTIGMVLFGSDTDTTWCAISREGETRRLGYASCEFLESEAATTVSPTPAPPAATPASPRPKPAPVTIREVPSAPLVFHEVRPAPPPVAPPPPAPKSAVAPKPAVADREDIVDAVLEGSGLRSEINSYTLNTRLAAFLDKGRLAEIDAAALDRVIAEEFQAKPFLAAIGAQIRKSDSADLPAVRTWVKSPEARKLSGLETRAYSPVSHQSLVAYAESLSATPPPEARLLLIHRIYDALRTCDMEVDATIALVYTTAEAIAPLLPVDKRYGPNELDRAMGPVKSRYRSIVTNARLVHYLFAFQSASDVELAQYAEFLESNSGKWLTSVVDKSFFEATESISRRLRSEISRLVQPRPH